MGSHGERVVWSMPSYAGLSLGSGWTTWVRESYDAAGNVTTIEKLDGEFAGSGTTLMEATHRGPGRPETRTLFGAGGVPIVRTYGYEQSTGRMNRMSVSAGGREIAGSEVAFDGLQRASARRLGMSGGERMAYWKYDDRGRLRASIHGVRGEADPDAGVPGSAKEVLTSSDFRTAQERTPRYDEATRAALAGKGVDVDALDPPTMTVEEKPGGGHKIGSIAQGADTRVFRYAGAEVVDDGRFVYEFDARGRLVRATEKGPGVPRRRIVYVYAGNDRLIGRRAEYATAVDATENDWRLEDRAAVLGDDGLPAESTFVWDAVTDRLLVIASAGANTSMPHGGIVRQYIHGGESYDDPLEVTLVDPTSQLWPRFSTSAAAADGQQSRGSGELPLASSTSEAGTPTQLYPVYDEAGAFALDSVINAKGELAWRNLPGDPYGAHDATMAGPAVERIEITATKSASDALSEIAITLNATDSIDAATVADGLRLEALDAEGAVLRSVARLPQLFDNKAVWKLPAGEWTVFVGGAESITVRVTSALRSATWGGDVAFAATGDSDATDGNRVDARVASATTEAIIARADASGSATSTVYEGSIVGVAEGGNSEVQLGAAAFHAYPFIELASGKAYARARWYDAGVGGFLSPDSESYVDSSNLYAFAGGDPVNGRDPRGLAVEPAPQPRYVVKTVEGGIEVTLPPPSLRLMRMWTVAQRAAENAKNAYRAALAEAGELFVGEGDKPVSSATLRKMIEEKLGRPLGADKQIDHLRDRGRLKGQHKAENLGELDKSVNMSNGARTGRLLRGIAEGTKIVKFNFTNLAVTTQMVSALTTQWQYPEFRRNFVAVWGREPDFWDDLAFSLSGDPNVEVPTWSSLEEF